jgi:rod shape determining protein RodA
MWGRFKTLDPWLFVLPLSLILVSVVFIYALEVDSPSHNLYLRQATYAGVGCVAAFGVSLIDYRVLRGWAGLIGGGMLALLMAVPLIGKEEFGAKLWINLGFFQFQPAELCKLVVTIILAAFLASNIRSTFSRFLVAIGLGVIPTLIVLLEPDLGTSLIIYCIALGVLLHAGLPRVQRGVLIVGTLLLASVIILSVFNVRPFGKLLKTYQKDRLISFIQPDRDRSGSGYNVLQSTIAVGAGGLMGQGLGFGSQSQLNFLPVAHTDFIFAVIGEAWGLLGTWGVLAVYALLISRILNAARIAKDRFGMLLCVGVAIKITVEVLINVGMNIRLMPVTGIPLPFLSFGGTTMLTNALCIGVVQSVVIRYKRLTF